MLKGKKPERQFTPPPSYDQATSSYVHPSHSVAVQIETENQPILPGSRGNYQGVSAASTTNHIRQRRSGHCCGFNCHIILWTIVVFIIGLFILNVGGYPPSANGI
ncbi:hypothetical protein K493DRAFT_310107 [Basidiobolus meristosporus CBS 931.73]|uniref:Uncharacterized protein n=1 Tax=Basidiobolus meristosporus CBS 931.73 TaxID=1314790 RepID=A0A1Y1ZBQ3_9FUNG|nr:hypothetical protein K493DRAFT_310107 [Basidiobolus meristosporus CBS 931.73]|eukprot:ORY07722.1 hypothetical protein K493DRAFT_310107 [Basidiobolus meristosporus CBS 931.73]